MSGSGRTTARSYETQVQMKSRRNPAIFCSVIRYFADDVSNGDSFSRQFWP